jgi:hypothetical protein
LQRSSQFVELRYIVELVLGVAHLGRDPLASADPTTKLMVGVLGLMVAN